MKNQQRQLPPIEKLKELFDYDTQEGKLWWKVDIGNRKAGTPAGSENSHGYLNVVIGGKVFRCHRILWVLHHGEDMKGPWTIDHKNGDKSDNRIENLRLANPSQNRHNQKVRKDNTSGMTGVQWHNKDKVWVVRWCGKEIGRSKDKTEALRMRQDAEEKYGNEWFMAREAS